MFGAHAAVPEAGGKGAALAKLAATFPVPVFFVISADAFDASGMKAAARAEVKLGLERLGAAGPFAVRSSGLEEDGAASAHAGQFATELNVASADVPAAAHRVWLIGVQRRRWRQYRIGQRAYRAHPQPPAVIVQSDGGGARGGRGLFG
jgi:phosphoenolpyruvate synthase/pyruvate phosphate dikinase